MVTTALTRLISLLWFSDSDVELEEAPLPSQQMAALSSKFMNNRGKFRNLNRGFTSGELIVGIKLHLWEQKKRLKKKTHLSSKDKAVSCCEGLVNIHHCEKPLVKLSEHGGCGPTLITAGIWKLWLQLRQNKICIAVSVQPACPRWKSCVVVAHPKGSCGRRWTRSVFKVQERSKHLNQHRTRKVVMCITEAVAVCLPVLASPDTSSRCVDGADRRICFYLEDFIITTGCQRCQSFLE